MKLSSLCILLITIFCILKPTLAARNDTMISCFICMELEYASVKQPCDDRRPTFHTCLLNRDLLNWKHVDDKVEIDVTFRCLLVYYTDKKLQGTQSLRGCIAEYEGYKICDHVSEIVKYKKLISCTVCDTRNCNAGLDLDENSGCCIYSKLCIVSIILSLLILKKCY